MVGMLLGDDAASVFFDGTLTDPQLDHPEGVAVHPDGSVWCGGERGQIYRLDADGRSLDEVASTGGFCLGMAFDAAAEHLYVCDLKHAAVFRLEVSSGRVERFAGDSFRIPNYPAFGPDGSLYVSDSHAFRDPGPGVWRVDVEGKPALWYDEPVNFANGLAFDADATFLYLAETFGNRVSRIALREDGSAGQLEPVVATPEAWPDGLAFDVEGNLYVACYEPSQVLRVGRDRRVDVLYREMSAHTVAHPTNVAFRGTTMFTANLGRWHITRLEVGVEGLRLPAATR